jgi:hypothetical protein
MFACSKTSMSNITAFTELVGNGKKTELWQDVYTKLQDAHFISYVDNYELKHFIADFKKIYKGAHSPQQIVDAVMACCKKRDKKISSDLFVLFVITKLG